MADYIGYSFQPGQQKRITGSLNQGSLSPLASDALRVLSLRLPTVLAGSAPAPAALLQPHVGGSAPDVALASTIARLNGGAPITTAPTPAPLPTAGPVASPIARSSYSPAPTASVGSSAAGSPRTPSAPTAAAPSSPTTPGVSRRARPDFGATGGGYGAGLQDTSFRDLAQLSALANAMLNSPSFQYSHNGTNGLGPFDSFGEYGGGGGRDYGGPQAT